MASDAANHAAASVPSRSARSGGRRRLPRAARAALGGYLSSVADPPAVRWPTPSPGMLSVEPFRCGGGGFAVNVMVTDPGP